MENKNELTQAQMEQTMNAIENFINNFRELVEPIFKEVMELIRKSLESFHNDLKSLESKINKQVCSDYHNYVPRTDGMIANSPSVRAEVQSKRATTNLVLSGRYNARKITK